MRSEPISLNSKFKVYTHRERQTKSKTSPKRREFLVSNHISYGTFSKENRKQSVQQYNNFISSERQRESARILRAKQIVVSRGRRRSGAVASSSSEANRWACVTIREVKPAKTVASFPHAFENRG